MNNFCISNTTTIDKQTKTMKSSLHIQLLLTRALLFHVEIDLGTYVHATLHTIRPGVLNTYVRTYVRMYVCTPSEV